MTGQTRFAIGPTGVLLLLLLAAPAAADDPAPSESPTHEVPAKFFVNYPAAEKFCPPIRTAFAEMESTLRFVRNKMVHVDPNGGYGMAYEMRGATRIHTGADIGWFKEGEPVFAVADGVVRVSQPGVRAMAAEQGRRLPGGPLDYGNLVVIEHRLPEGDGFFSLYGHLGDDRLVATGDLVTVGQQIGTIGRKAAIVNGGYEAHLHFGIREGTLFEPGDQIMELTINGQHTPMQIVALGEDRTRVALTPDPGLGDFTLTTRGQGLEVVQEEDGTYSVPSRMLYTTAPRGTSFAGYASSLEGWTDPIAFLRGKGANVHPPQAMFVTPCRDADFERRYILGDPAPSWSVAEWHRPANSQALDASDFAGKVVALFCFDIDCRASQTHGLPGLTHVAAHYNGDTEVAVVGLLTPTGRRRASRTEVRRLLQQLPPQVSLGSCARPRETPAILDDYQICGTPWIILIDKGGVVQFSNYTVRAEEIIRRVDELKSP